MNDDRPYGEYLDEEFRQLQREQAAEAAMSKLAEKLRVITLCGWSWPVIRRWWGAREKVWRFCELERGHAGRHSWEW